MYLGCSRSFGCSISGLVGCGGGLCLAYGFWVSLCLAGGGRAPGLVEEFLDAGCDIGAPLLEGGLQSLVVIVNHGEPFHGECDERDDEVLVDCHICADSAHVQAEQP